MDNIKDIIKKYLNRNYLSNKFYDSISSYYTFNKLGIDELKEIKSYLTYLNKIELFDDFLMLYFKQDLNNIDYKDVINILNNLNYGLNRRLIIILITSGIINKDNISEIDDREIRRYYDIFSFKEKNTLDVNDLCKNYKNIECLTTNYHNYFYIQSTTIPELDEYDELKLLLDYKVNNSINARDYLIISNLRLVLKKANQIYNVKKTSGFNATEVDDLFTYGLFGLIKAIDYYDITTGKKFSTYATYTISQNIRRESLKDRLIVLPENLAMKPDDLNLSLETRIKLENAMQPFISINDSISDDSEDELMDFLDSNNSLVKDNSFDRTTEDKVIENIIKDSVNEALRNNLDEKKEDVIRRRYGLDDFKKTNLADIASDYNVSAERIRQIEENTLKQLKNNSDFIKLNNFVNDLDNDSNSKQDSNVEEIKEAMEEKAPKTKLELKREKLEKLKKIVDKNLAIYFGQDKFDVLNEYNSYGMLTDYLLENESIIDTACKIYRR